MSLRVRLYDSTKAWIADELVYDAGVDAPILPIAGLVDPNKVTSVACSVDGYIASPDLHRFTSTAPASDPGRKSCSERNGLDVDGGPDADFAAAVIGRDWIMAQFFLSINHFFPDQETDFNGDVFAASLDRGAEQKIVVSGKDGQSSSYLFTNVRPGMHQIDYGPWAVNDAVRQGGAGFSRGYHNLCLRVGTTPTRVGRSLT